MDLFDYMREQNQGKESPLASRLRPTKLEEVAGQQHIIGKDKLLYRAIQADKLSSIIFYGPPGTGKTTLAKVIANTTSAEFTQINATSAGKKDMEQVVQQAKDNQGMYGKKTILFIDEIHRFNKGQQDYLLPFVEDGTIILIGATTENPYFEVNNALLSRSVVFELKPLAKEDIKKILLRALADEEKGLGAYHAQLETDALEFLADVANGDARAALTAVELGVLTTPRGADGRIHITLEVASECIQKRAVRYDKSGDNHYDTVSAFIKSMRGSDPGCSRILLSEDALCRGRHKVHCQKDYDMCGGGCGECRSPGFDGGSQRSPGRRTHRYARGADNIIPGSDLCGLRPQKQRSLHGDRTCHAGSEGYAGIACPGTSYGCPLPWSGEIRAWRRISVCP